mgnify:CR=1 FL=1
MNVYYIIFLNMIVTLGLSFISDRFFSYIIIPSARYFTMHVILNAYISYITYNTTIHFLLNPIAEYNYHSEIGISSCSMIIGFHMYHILTEKLNLEDKMHHIITVFITGSAGLLSKCGDILAAINFFMCGLPGGLDYLLLVFLKYNLISKITEKYINRWLNLLIRMPGMMLCFWYSMLNIYYGNLNIIQDAIPIIAVCIMTINSIYYCNKTVGNYHVRLYEKQKSMINK